MTKLKPVNNIQKKTIRKQIAVLIQLITKLQSERQLPGVTVSMSAALMTYKAGPTLNDAGVTNPFAICNFLLVIH